MIKYLKRTSLRWVLYIMTPLIIPNVYSQTNSNSFSRNLRVTAICEFEYAYLISGVDTTIKDTMYFISLKLPRADTCKCANIKINTVYTFIIKDIDMIQGKLMTSLPYKQYIKAGQGFIRRDGRNGKDLYNTQYYSVSTIGLCFEAQE